MKLPESKLRRSAFSKITVLCLLAVLVASLGISIANDLYAFVKPDRAIDFTVDSPHSLEELSKDLDRKGVIANPTVFRLYVKSKGKEELLESFCGTVTLNASMSYREILLSFSQ